ncbi:MAG: hypothetical protein OEX74_15930, partial [Gammaproteobacteria bacterium]|nr:hypothetical protein [Gammaproteobacteria bacterium]
GTSGRYLPYRNCPHFSIAAIQHSVLAKFARAGNGQKQTLGLNSDVRFSGPEHNDDVCHAVILVARRHGTSGTLRGPIEKGCVHRKSSQSHQR